MENLTQYQFSARNLKVGLGEWVVFRYFDEATARSAYKEISLSEDHQSTELQVTELPEPFVRYFPSHSQYIHFDTTGLVIAGTYANHYATGTVFEHWYCLNKDLSAVKGRLEAKSIS